MTALSYTPTAMEITPSDDALLHIFAPKQPSAEASSSRLPTSFLKASTRAAQASLQQSKRQVEEAKDVLEKKELELRSILSERNALAKVGTSDSMQVDDDGVVSISIELPEDLPSEEYFHANATDEQKASLPPRDDPEYSTALLQARLELEMLETTQREQKVKELTAQVKALTRDNEGYKKRSIIADLALEDVQKQMARAKKALDEVVPEDAGGK